METITTLLYIALKSRYGETFMNKHFHGIILHFPQDFASVFQRMASCERGEFLISVAKKVALCESNCTQPNALTNMVLSLTASIQRLLDGETDTYVDDKKMFADIDIKECNFTLSGSILNSKFAQDLIWFSECYLVEKELDQFVTITRTDNVLTEIKFLFSDTWNECKLDSDKLVYNSQKSPVVIAAEKVKNKTKCTCGSRAHRQCNSDLVSLCQHSDPNKTVTYLAPNHTISADKFLQKNQEKVGTGDGMLPIAGKRAHKAKKNIELASIINRMTIKTISDINDHS